MARVAKSEHAAIRRMVETEGRKPGEVAAEYGCTPANIYAIIGKLRRDEAAAKANPPRLPVPLRAEAMPVEAAPADAPPPPAADLFEAAVVPLPASPPAAQVEPAPTTTGSVTPFARRGAAKGGVGGKLAKPGVGLCMRTPDGEDSLTPFRSLEDLLSAIKPILRATARNPETVWFSVQPVDLASIDSDAA